MLINSLVGIFLFGTAALTVMILAMANAIISMKNAKLVELNQHDAQSALSLALSKGLISPEWEADSGFFPEGAFRVLGLNHEIQMIIWSQEEHANYFCVNLVQGAPTTFEFVTIWENGVLSTGSNRDGHAMPKREFRWLQTFDEKDASGLWHHHEKAIAHLSSMYPELRTKRPDIKNDFENFMKAESKYVRSLSLWPLRLAYWFFILRFTDHNKPVAPL